MTPENCLPALEGAELMESAQTWPGCDRARGEICPSPCRAARVQSTTALSLQGSKSFSSPHGPAPMILISLLCEVVWGCSLYEKHSKTKHSRVLNSRRTCPHVAAVSHIAGPFVWRDSATHARRCHKESEGSRAGRSKWFISAKTLKAVCDNPSPTSHCSKVFLARVCLEAPQALTPWEAAAPEPPEACPGAQVNDTPVGVS